MFEEMFRLDGKKALVTGGAQGLGRMISEALLSAGASVTITSRKAHVAEQAASEMGKLGECRAIVCDLASVEGALALAAAYRAGNASLDILVNNAGRTWGAPIESFPDKAWANVMGVNVHIPFKLVQLLLPELRAGASARDPARVINIGSIAGVRTEDLRAYSYVASKAAIHQLSKQLAADLAADNIAVNAIIPGYFATAMTAHIRGEGDAPNDEVAAHIPLGRFGLPDEIGALAVFLSSRGGAYITGANIPVDGGLSGCR